jgi:hypothetical protein
MWNRENIIWFGFGIVNEILLVCGGRTMGSKECNRGNISISREFLHDCLNLDEVSDGWGLRNRFAFMLEDRWGIGGLGDKWRGEKKDSGEQTENSRLFSEWVETSWSDKPELAGVQWGNHHLE